MYFKEEASKQKKLEEKKKKTLKADDVYSDDDEDEEEDDGDKYNKMDVDDVKSSSESESGERSSDEGWQSDEE